MLLFSMTANRMVMRAQISHKLGFVLSPVPSLLWDLQQLIPLSVTQFPQLQSKEILPVIILPRSDVVIKMAVSAFCKIKNKKKKTKPPAEDACYLYQVFARISEKAIWSKTLQRSRTGIGF